MRELDEFDFAPTLCGETIALRPLTGDDFESVYAAAADPLIWEQHPFPLRYQRDVFESGFWKSAIDSPGALVISERATGNVIGSSRFYEWKPQQREVAIGYTFLSRKHWGGKTNRELKSLMLEHAFRWAKVVWFHVGSTNYRSRRALEKIGAVFSHEEAKENHGVIHTHAFYRIHSDSSGVSCRPRQ